MKERPVEQYLRRGVEARGGVCLKITPNNAKGFPDRLVILPHVTPQLVEVKKPRGGVVAEHQLLWGRKLRSMDVRCEILSSPAEVDAFLSSYDELMALRPGDLGHA